MTRTESSSHTKKILTDYKLDNKQVCKAVMSHEQEINLDRFANLMIELIERHADAVNKVEENII